VISIYLTDILDLVIFGPIGGQCGEEYLTSSLVIFRKYSRSSIERMVKRNKIGRSGNNRSLKTMVRQMIDAKKEHKLYTASLSYTDSVAGTVTEMTSGIVVGDTLTSRDGDVIAPSKLVINYTLLSGVGSTNSAHRIIIFQDTMNRGAVPAVGDVLSSGLYAGGYNVINQQQGRFKILYDKLHGVVGAADSAVVHIQRSIPLKGLIHYQASAGNATDNGKNSVFILTCCDSVTVSTAVVTAGWTVHYTDS